MLGEPAPRAPEDNAWDRPRKTTTPQPSRPAFGFDRPTARRGGIGLLIAILASGVLHLSVFGGVAVWNWIHPPPAAPEKGSDVEMVDVSQMPSLKVKLDEIRRIAKLDEARRVPAPVPTPPPDPRGQIVNLAHPATPEKAPADAKFRAEDDHSVKEESVSRDVAVAPKVVADSFKGMGDKPNQGEGKLSGDPSLRAEGFGHDAKTEHATRGTADAVADVTPAPKLGKTVSDVFGMLRPHEDDAPPPEGRQGDSDHSADTDAAGGGTKLAMAGAPSNDYLPGMRVGDKTALNAKKDFFASFWIRVQNQVEPFWVKHINEVPVTAEIQKRDYLTRVNVTLGADGSLIAVDIVQSCGMPGWDRAVQQAFQDAAPFLNPPRGMVDPDGKIRMPDLGFVVGVRPGQVVHMYGDPRSDKLFPGVGEGYGPMR